MSERDRREIIVRYSQPGGTGIDAAYAQRDGIILALAELIAMKCGSYARRLTEGRPNIRPPTICTP